MVCFVLPAEEHSCFATSLRLFRTCLGCSRRNLWRILLWVLFVRCFKTSQNFNVFRSRSICSNFSMYYRYWWVRIERTGLHLSRSALRTLLLPLSLKVHDFANKSHGPNKLCCVLYNYWRYQTTIGNHNNAMGSEEKGWQGKAVCKRQPATYLMRVVFSHIYCSRIFIGSRKMCYTNEWREVHIPSTHTVQISHGSPCLSFSRPFHTTLRTKYCSKELQGSVTWTWFFQTHEQILSYCRWWNYFFAEFSQGEWLLSK